MPIKIALSENPEKEIAWLCGGEWRLPTQVAALEVWLKRKRKMKAGDYYADLGFMAREDAGGGGSALTPAMMRKMSEPLELRVKDVLWDEGPTGQLMIRGAKGGKDRRVPLPRGCVDPLKRQIERARTVWETDRRESPLVGVVLPHSLAKKYPRAPFHWQWFWIFPAPNHCTHPREGTRVRYHLLVDSLQRVVYNAAEKLELEGVVTPHCLRHAYATHSRESIDALRQLLGHASIETTAGYRHPAIEQASNPLDDLLA